MADPAEDEGGDHSESSVIKDLRARAKRAEEAEARAQQAERELGLHKAGLSHLDEDQITALVGQGEFDVDAVKAKAEKWGWTEQSGTAPTQQPSPGSPPPPDNGVEQIQEFSRGGTGNEPSPNAKTQLNQGVNDLIARGATPDKVLEYLFEQNASTLDS